jgi:hypothetical protein
MVAHNNQWSENSALRPMRIAVSGADDQKNMDLILLEVP